MNDNFTIHKTDKPKEKPDQNSLGFGKYFSDHMFVMEYTKGKGWHDGKIVPYGPISLDPAAAVLHYAIEMFEGMKAYKTKDGRTLLFRPEMNAKRLNITCDRLCIPEMDEKLFLDAVKAIVDFEKDWIPQGEGRSLYIRPFIIADEVFVGLRPAEHFTFIVFLSPVGSYYAGGLSPTKLLVEDEYIRAAPGGTGYAKVGGNYAGTLKAQQKAIGMGLDQVLWLDGVEKKYVEEIGASNAFFVIDGEVVTPPAGGTILKGITRDSCLQLLKKWGYKVSERKVSIEEIFNACESGKLDEAFATGTAAVISPVGELTWKGKKIAINGGKTGAISQRLYDELYGIQTGELEDSMGWTVEV
ncbi:MAG: branched-chain amino acid aminotransferase [Clostridiales bacterium]|nr:branched-chain amino acid aminotransferase [Clostridiales bacterium]